MFFFNLYYH